MQQNYFMQLNRNWKHAFEQPSYTIQFVFTVIIITCIALFFPGYFDYLEARNGVVLHDYLLDTIEARDVSWMVFICLYFGIMVALICILIDPQALLIALQTYALVTILRITTLYFIRLDPPVGYIEMKDPLFSMLFTTHGKICSKDLFFSGHVSTILSLYFATQQKTAKRFILLFTLLIALGVVIQHVHYTIDVLVAPLVTYWCYLVSKKITSLILHSPSSFMSTG